MNNFYCKQIFAQNTEINMETQHKVQLHPEVIYHKDEASRAVVAHAYNPRYLGG
jgi:hypothetical protein